MSLTNYLHNNWFEKLCIGNNIKYINLDKYTNLDYV